MPFGVLVFMACVVGFGFLLAMLKTFVLKQSYKRLHIRVWLQLPLRGRLLVSLFLAWYGVFSATVTIVRTDVRCDSQDVLAKPLIVAYVAVYGLLFGVAIAVLLWSFVDSECIRFLTAPSFCSTLILSVFYFLAKGPCGVLVLLIVNLCPACNFNGAVDLFMILLANLHNRHLPGHNSKSIIHQLEHLQLLFISVPMVAFVLAHQHDTSLVAWLSLTFFALEVAFLFVSSVAFGVLNPSTCGADETDDVVNFSVISPPKVAAGQLFELEVWATEAAKMMDAIEQEVEAGKQLRAKPQQNPNIPGSKDVRLTVSPMCVAADAIVEVTLQKMEYCRIDGERTQELAWEGKLNSHDVKFRVRVDSDVPLNSVIKGEVGIKCMQQERTLLFHIKATTLRRHQQAAAAEHQRTSQRDVEEPLLVHEEEERMIASSDDSDDDSDSAHSVHDAEACKLSYIPVITCLPAPPAMTTRSAAYNGDGDEGNSDRAAFITADKLKPRKPIGGCAGNSKGSARGIPSGGTWSKAAQAHLGKYKKRMQEETASAESAGKGEDAIIAHVEPLLREEMRRDSLTEETAEELIKRLVGDYQCESGSDEDDDEANMPELVSYSNPTIRKAIKKDGYEKHEISYAEVAKATKNLEEIIGEGAFATVYSGVLFGKEVAVKVEKGRGDEAKAKQAFINEIKVVVVAVVSAYPYIVSIGTMTAVANM
jgi:hypothetical protein